MQTIIQFVTPRTVRNAWGGTGYGMTSQGQDPDKYTRPSEYISEPRIYWEAA